MELLFAAVFELVKRGYYNSASFDGAFGTWKVVCKSETAFWWLCTVQNLWLNFSSFFKRNQGSLFFPLHSIWNFNSPHSGSFSLVRNPPSVPSCQLLPFSGLGVIRFWSDSCNFNEITWSSSCGESLSSHPGGGESYPQERFESMKPTDKGHKKTDKSVLPNWFHLSPGGKKASAVLLLICHSTTPLRILGFCW